jgi:hypothetical protein
MSDYKLVASHKHLPAMTAAEVDKVRELEAKLEQMPQLELTTHHIIHGGTYSRTVMMPAGSALTGALLTIPTSVIVCGRATVFIGERTLELDGYNVLPASAGRKQAFYAHTDVWLTMFCATDLQTVAEIEDSMTDEAGRLLSRRVAAENNLITITGE